MTTYVQYEGWDINLKKIFKSFRFRLWMFFALFTALIFTILWLLQTVFLQSFYDAMLINNTKAAAQKIISSGSSSNINDTIDELTHDNAILVFITSEDGSVLFSSDEFKGGKKVRKNGQEMLPDDLSIDNRPDFSDKRMNYRMLPEGFNEFLSKLKESDSGTVQYTSDSIFIYGSYMDYYGSDSRAVLYVGATIDTVGPSVSIISMQLVWVTGLSLIIGFILSWFIAKRFSVPLDKLSEKARKIGGKEYSPEFKKGFCSELDELNDTLDTTNEKLIKARNFQMELLANVSHDLRTPLTMIKGYAEMIRDISWSDEEQCAADLAVIIKEADRLTALVNEILEYSELQSDTLPDDKDAVDLSLLINRAADTFEALYKPEKLIVERRAADGIFVSGSTARLERAVYNLLDNAVRHTGENKTVRICLTAEEGKAHVEVTDFGAGIPEGEVEHIWDRYYTSRQRGGKGVSGLGLAIVKKIVTLHGGECSVSSEQGKGCTFVITLPLA